MREPAWIPPDGLERARPREVRLTRGGQMLLALSLSLWFGAPAAVAALQGISSRQAAEQRSFAEKSVLGVAEVTRLWRARGEGRPAWVEYRIEVAGLRYPGQARLRLREWRRLDVGSRLPVRYLRDDPSVSRAALGAGARGPLPDFAAYVVGAALALIAGCALLPLRSQRRMLSEGRPAPGRVTRHKKGQHGTEFEFEFTSLSGTRCTGKSGPRAKPPAVGSSLCVLYDPDHPKRNAVYPLSLVTPLEKRSLRARRYNAAAASSTRSTSAGLT